MSATSLFWLTFAPVIAAGVTALVVDSFAARRSVLGPASVSMLLAAGGLSGLVGAWVALPTTVYGTFVVGGARSLVAGLVALLAAAVVLAGSDERASGSGVMNALISLAAAGAAFAVSANDLVAVLLASETAALCGYALVASGRSRGSAEAAMKYFVLGAVSTGLFVLGISVSAASTRGALSFEALGVATRQSPSAIHLTFAALMVVAALAAKAGAAPLHWWAPDAYQWAPARASAFLAGGVKLSAVSVLALFVAGVAAGGGALVSADLAPDGVGFALALAAVVSMLVGSLGALHQQSYTRMLGYAGIAQVGFALMGASSGSPGAAIILVATYAVASTAVFLAAEVFRSSRPGWDGTVEGLAGIGRQRPVVGGAVTVALMSLAGVPPLLGFWGKFQALGAAASKVTSAAGASVVWAAWAYGALTIIGTVTAVVSLGYYGSVVRAMFFEAEDASAASAAEAGAEGEETRRRSPIAGAVVVALGIALLVGGAAPLVIGMSRAFGGFTLG